MHEFLAVVTSKRIFRTATPMAVAIDAIDAWLESPSLALLCESGEHWTELRRLLGTSQAVGPMVHDARIAALCVEHGVSELWTADRDFGRFAGIKALNPLVG